MAEPLSFRLPAHLKLKDIDRTAKERGMSRAALVINATEFVLGLDTDFLRVMEKYSKALRVPVSLVMQNMVIKRLAEDAARAELYGHHENVFDEFAYHTVDGESKPMGYHDLFNYLKGLKIQELRQKKEAYLTRRINEKKSLGLPLNEEEQALSDLIKERDAAAQKIEELWMSGKIELVEGDD